MSVVGAFSGKVMEQLQTSQIGRTDAGGKPGTVGHHGGEEVRAPKSRLAILAEAAEELSFLKAEKKSQKSLKDSKVEDRSKASELQKIVQRMMSKVKEPNDQEKLDKFFARLMLMDSASREGITDLLSKSFDDISLQYMAAMYALQELKRKKARKKGSAASDAMEAELEGLINDMEANQGEAIRAGINVSDAGRAYESEGLGTVQEYRNFYRDSVLDYGGLAQAYASIVKEKGPDNFPASIRMLKEGLSADLDSSGPSIEESKLQLIIDDMYQLTVLEDMHFQSFDMIRKAEDLYRLVLQHKGHSILQKILDSKDRHLLKTQTFSSLYGALGVELLQAKIYIAQALLRMSREMPKKVFNTEKHRDNLLSTIQALVDELIDQEEDEDSGGY